MHWVNFSLTLRQQFEEGTGIDDRRGMVKDLFQQILRHILVAVGAAVVDDVEL